MHPNQEPVEGGLIQKVFGPKQSEWEKEFDENFKFFCEEHSCCFGDGKDLKAFIHKTVNEAIAGERVKHKQALEVLLNSQRKVGYMGWSDSEVTRYNEGIRVAWGFMFEALTPSPDTSKEL